MAWRGGRCLAALYLETAAGLRQYFVLMPCKMRLVGLLAFLRWYLLDDRRGKAIVFSSSRDSVTFFEQLLAALAAADVAVLGDLPLFFLHGGHSQQARTLVFQKFTACTRGLLFSTDVASGVRSSPRGRSSPALTG